jgi:NAD(P)-dependent dehydrogenase (short-subunit alcohol dehydrogenase family)
MKTILITGCSSGFGLDIARYFLERGDWNVVATMRTPHTDLLPVSSRLRVMALDVKDPASIRQVVDAAGPIDVLVNNAGIGLLGAVEGTQMETVRDVFETNTFGTFALIKAVLPQMRERRSGTIVNVSSSTTMKTLPLLSEYTASKAAVNAFSASLALELAEFNVQVKIVLPGSAPETSFGTTARTRMQNAFPAPYADFAKRVMAGMGDLSLVTHALDVSEAVWRAATDPASPLRIPAGADAVAWDACSGRFDVKTGTP